MDHCSHEDALRIPWEAWVSSGFWSDPEGWHTRPVSYVLSQRGAIDFTPWKVKGPLSRNQNDESRYISSYFPDLLIPGVLSLGMSGNGATWSLCRVYPQREWWFPREVKPYPVSPHPTFRPERALLPDPSKGGSSPSQPLKYQIPRLSDDTLLGFCWL